MFIPDPHPRDKGACLPNFITPHSYHFIAGRAALAASFAGPGADLIVLLKQN
jgi:hypothetical protein